MQLFNLSNHCAYFELKNCRKKNELSKKINNINLIKGRDLSFMKLYDTLKFDELHSSYAEGKQPTIIKKKESETTIEEKQNNN